MKKKVILFLFPIVAAILVACGEPTQQTIKFKEPISPVQYFSEHSIPIGDYAKCPKANNKYAYLIRGVGFDEKKHSITVFAEDFIFKLGAKYPEDIIIYVFKNRLP